MEDAAEAALPKHARVREELARWIARDLSPGDRLPGERRLEQLHGVSRITVRRAIADLVSDGVLVREHGRGTFVGSGRARSRLHLASFHEDMRASGLRPSTRPLLVREEQAPPAAVAHLGAERALRVRRLRLGDDRPVSIDDCWVAPGILDPQADWTGSLYALLERAGAPIVRAEQTVEAAGACPEDAQLLGLAPDAPVLVFRRCTFTVTPGQPEGAAELPVDWSTSVYRGDRYQLSMEVRG